METAQILTAHTIDFLYYAHIRERRNIRYIVMSYTTARANTARFRAMAGMDVETFDLILSYFTDSHDEYFRWHMLLNALIKNKL